MLIENIENKLKKIEQSLDKKNFIYDFLEAYEQPKSTIKRLKDGDYNLSKNSNELIWKKKIYFYTTKDNEDIHDIIDSISKSEVIEKYKIRFVIVTDFEEFLSIDKKNNSTLDIKINELSKNVDFFLPLSGLEKAKDFEESEADIAAAYKMGQLYDKIILDNPHLTKTNKSRHSLNIFFVRLLFCYFAEDSGIFEKAIFTKSLISLSSEDGSDLDIFIDKLFNSLKIEKKDTFSEVYKKFPYVNGDLFKNDYSVPKFTIKSRKILIDCGQLDWNSINPDILGSMMQAVVHQGIRDQIGMHYTSVSNILKVISPLFLDSLYEEFDLAKNDIKKLKSILIKIYNTVIFDPACGSGNFLVIAYKELYKIEIKVLKKLKEIDQQEWLITQSGIKLTNFYGIEQDDFAHEAAKLSLWIAQHQMNIIYNELLDEIRPTLPLSPSGNFISANSVNVDWNDFCKVNKNEKIYLIGNPPYKGSKRQNNDQKKDLIYLFDSVYKDYKNLDYISCWFYKGSQFIADKKAELAFVSTNSISQGEQVFMLWKNILQSNLEIHFAHQSFQWKNNAKHKAGVICVIIGLRNRSQNKKFLIKGGTKTLVSNINPYLVNYKNVYIKKTSKPISNLPIMSFGNMPLDNGNLLLNEDEKNELLKSDKKAEKFIRPFVGAEEFLHGIKRYCIWIREPDKDEAQSIEAINERIKKVKKFREKSVRLSTNKLAKRPYQFANVREAKLNSLIIPESTSETRDYIPMGFIDQKTIVSNAGNVVYDPPIYLLSLLSSKMHMSWVFAVSGALKSDIRYSIGISYNTFPVPSLSVTQVKSLENFSFELIEEREKYSDKTLAEIYDIKKMPISLKSIHNKIDKETDVIFSGKAFQSNNDRLIFLFNMYENYTKVNTLI
tara:strand:- start:3405 stop:6074 length:2670 start_codon:yes stop_codon:yes gene_type:complete